MTETTNTLPHTPFQLLKDIGKGRDVFIILTHFILPAHNQHRKEPTHEKDWWKTGQKYVHEDIKFTSNLKDHQLSSASYIVNLSQQKVIKNRFRDKEDDSIILDRCNQVFEERAQEIIKKLNAMNNKVVQEVTE